MRKYLVEIVLVLTLTYAALAAMLFLPYDKQYAYQQLLPSCGRGEWMYGRIFLNDNPVEIAFLGSSRMICGVQDSLLERLLFKENIPEGKVANLAFCRYGRPLNYAIYKDLLRRHRPEILVLEVRELESMSSHPDFPCIAEPDDLLFPAVHTGYLKQLVEGVQYRLQYQINSMLGSLPLFDTLHTRNNYLEHLATHRADPKMLATIKKGKEVETSLGRLESKWRHYFGKYYLQKMAALSANYGVELVFLYLPAYAARQEFPAELAYYARLGKVLIPPSNIFQTDEYRVDADHLNAEGAALLTYWLAGQFANFE